jgi:hypothetical protein
MHSWSTFGARTSHGQIRTHKTHHGPNLGEATTFPLIVYSVLLHEAHIQMAFCPKTPKWESRNCQNQNFCDFEAPITLCADLQLRWGLKQSCNPCREVSKGMWHATCTRGNQVNSRLLVVGSQIANLTPGLSFGHNLCFGCPNGSCEPIFDIYVSIDFQWYKKKIGLLGFDLCNHSLNIRESTGTPTPNMGVHLGMWRFFPSHSFALSGHENATPGLNLGPHLCKPFAFVASPRLGSQHVLNHFNKCCWFSLWTFLKIKKV